MRHILRRRELTADAWHYLGEDALGSEAVIVPLAELRANPARFAARGGRLGVRLAPVDRVEDLAGDLPRLALVACEFPSPGEGRGYSQGRLLRERFRFTGELRAVGAGVKQDLVFHLARCGFDALELAPGEDSQAAITAWGRYDVAYQPGDARVKPRLQRFFAA